MSSWYSHCAHFNANCEGTKELPSSHYSMQNKFTLSPISVSNNLCKLISWKQFRVRKGWRWCSPIIHLTKQPQGLLLAHRSWIGLLSIHGYVFFWMLITSNELYCLVCLLGFMTSVECLSVHILIDVHFQVAFWNIVKVGEHLVWHIQLNK